jgi:hypothetical protein
MWKHVVHTVTTSLWYDSVRHTYIKHCPFWQQRCCRLHVIACHYNDVQIFISSYQYFVMTITSKSAFPHNFATAWILYITPTTDFQMFSPPVSYKNAWRSGLQHTKLYFYPFYIMTVWEQTDETDVLTDDRLMTTGWWKMRTKYRFYLHSQWGNKCSSFLGYNKILLQCSEFMIFCILSLYYTHETVQ